jgi:hypothetical protein
MNRKRAVAAGVTGLLAFAGTMAILIWAPLWAVWAAFVPSVALLAAWDLWLDHIPALAPRPGTLVRVNALGRPVRFQALGAGQLRPAEAAELARRDRELGLLDSVSGAGGPKPLEAPLPPTVARVLAREAAERLAETGDITAAIRQAELSARGPWN